MIKSCLSIAAAALFLSGCDQVNQKLGLEDPAKKEAKIEAEARAVGSACRQSGRAIEDCYAIYAWLPKAGIYAGWREMDEYMRENKIDTIAPQLPPAEPPGSKKRKTAPPAAETTGDAATSGAAANGETKAAPAEKAAEKK